MEIESPFFFFFIRQIISQLCGWSNVDPKSAGYDRIASLLEEDEYEKVAALYIFQMNVIRALEILHEALQRGSFSFLLFRKKSR